VEVYPPSSCFSCLFFIVFHRVKLLSLPLRLGLIVLFLNELFSSIQNKRNVNNNTFWFKLRTTKINIFASEIVVSSTQPHDHIDLFIENRWASHYFVVFSKFLASVMKYWLIRSTLQFVYSLMYTVVHSYSQVLYRIYIVISFVNRDRSAGL
jgi:hypothetical protein